MTKAECIERAKEFDAARENYLLLEAELIGILPESGQITIGYLTEAVRCAENAVFWRGLAQQGRKARQALLASGQIPAERFS